MANGVARPTQNALNHSPKAFNPRIGVAWDVTGKGDWVVRGGFGVYANWLTAGERAGGVPRQPAGLDPADLFRRVVDPADLRAGNRQHAALWIHVPEPGRLALCARWHHVSTTKAASRAPHSPIGGINPDLKTPTAYIYTAARRAQDRQQPFCSVLYSGSHSDNLVGNGNQAGLVSYGVDINALPGDLLDKPAGSAPTRLNPSFGPHHAYADNDRVANYNGDHVRSSGAVRSGLLRRAPTRDRARRTMPASTRRRMNPHQFYGPSPWDVPNRFSPTVELHDPGYE